MATNTSILPLLGGVGYGDGMVTEVSLRPSALNWGHEHREVPLVHLPLPITILRVLLHLGV